MPSLSQHQSSETTKLLFLGDSGSGKTGALASLADAGYNLRIMDLDNGLDVLKNLLTDPKSPYGKEAVSRVQYVTLTDPMKNVNGKMVPAKATVWNRAIGLMTRWQEHAPGAKPGEPPVVDLGPVASWGSQDVLVIDSLTLLCTAALNFQLSMNARLGSRTEQSDWFAAQQMVESLFQTLYDEGVRCNVVVNCHVDYREEENGPTKGLPLSLGKALSPKLGRYFNSMLLARTRGSGAQERHKILTVSTPSIELKNTAPLRVKPEYDLGTGLAEYFAAVRQSPDSSVKVLEGTKPTT